VERESDMLRALVPFPDGMILELSTIHVKGPGMRNRTSILLGVAVLLPSLATAAKPEGWFLAGREPQSYEMELDNKVAHEGKSSARLASIRKPTGFGTMLQSFSGEEYRGKRLRLAAFVKARDVRNWAGLWMRVDGPERSAPLAFDNMEDRPIKGTRDWERLEIVLDVGETATAVYFGLLMDGEGTVWLDDLEFDVVDASVPTTGRALAFL
jgi:hypothetical protein